MMFGQTMKAGIFALGDLTDSYFEKHLHLKGREAVSLLDSWIPLEEGSSRHSPTHPLNGNHLTVGCNECRVRVLLHESGFNA